MAISVGDTLPEASFMVLGGEGPAAMPSADVWGGKTVVIFGLPGAYTGTCSTAHVPSFIRTAEAFKAKGIAGIYCVSVNDPFVLGAWSEATGAGAAGIVMLGDAEAAFTKAIGLDFSAPPVGLIDRSKRYAMVVEDGKVTVLHVEDNPGVCETSGGEALLEAI
ncbi:MAG: peroxiredoxin [Pseudomonadota bacterium]